MPDKPKTLNERFKQANSWHVALVAVAVAWLGKGGCDRLADAFLHDSRSFEAVALSKLDALQKSVDQLWKIKGPRQEQKPGE